MLWNAGVWNTSVVTEPSLVYQKIAVIAFRCEIRGFYKFKKLKDETGV